MKVLKITLSLMFVLLLLNNTQAQENKLNIDKLSIGANFGSLLSYGDIKQYDFWPTPDERKWGGGAVINYQVSPIFSFQAQGLTGKLAGIKRNFISGAPASLKFDAEIYEGSFNFTVSLNRWWAPHLKANEWLNVYGLAGIGLVKFRTQQRGLYNDNFIRSFGWSDKGTVKEKMTTETVIPLGLGVKVKLHDKVDLNLESTIRSVNTDKLDAFVRNNNARDKYGYTSIGIIFRIGKQDNHMEWSTPKDIESAADKLALDNLNKKISDLESKIGGTEQPQQDLSKINDLEKKIAELESKIENMSASSSLVTSDGQVDLQKLAELDQKIKDLEGRNREINTRIDNLKTGTTTETIVKGGSAVGPVVISVFFEVNKSNIDKSNTERVAAAAKLMKADPSVKIELIGHADKSGGQRYNELLSERRAKAVYDALVKDYGIDSSRLSISYKGFADPLSQKNLDVNRRVDFVVK